jgi:serine/threonine protein phosphatase PrpC
MTEGVSLFGVFDGHGGPEVSAYASNHLAKILKESPFFAKDRMELALENAYYQIDTELRSEEG